MPLCDRSQPSPPRQQVDSICTTNSLTSGTPEAAPSPQKQPVLSNFDLFPFASENLPASVSALATRRRTHRRLLGTALVDQQTPVDYVHGEPFELFFFFSYRSHEIRRCNSWGDRWMNYSRRYFRRSQDYHQMSTLSKSSMTISSKLSRRIDRKASRFNSFYVWLLMDCKHSLSYSTYLERRLTRL